MTVIHRISTRWAFALLVICFGALTFFVVGGMIQAREDEFRRGIALGRVGTPEDVAQVVLFLATAEPSFMTGQALVVDGFQWAC